MTNRELYQAIGALCERHKTDTRSLEQYLLALLGLARQHRHQTALSASEFYSVISEAYAAEPLPFAASWRVDYDALNAPPPGFPCWEATVTRQIVNLREMDEAGILADELRYFGVTAPRGEPWYNFDPGTYLECAMAGAFGGWEPGDSTGRQLVPGEVVTWDANGNEQVMNPEDIERPVNEMAHISWDQFIDFVECGQMYE